MTQLLNWFLQHTGRQMFLKDLAFQLYQSPANPICALASLQTTLVCTIDLSRKNTYSLDFVSKMLNKCRFVACLFFTYGVNSHPSLARKSSFLVSFYKISVLLFQNFSRYRNMFKTPLYDPHLKSVFHLWTIANC